MPEPPAEVYGRVASEFDKRTQLDELPDAFREMLESFVEHLDGPAVLDAGCGPGRDAAYFAEQGLDPVGVDLAAGMVEYARKHRPGRYLRMDLRALGFPANSFDGVWCPASVFFVPYEGMATALGEFERVLRPGGVARVGFKLGDGRLEVEKWGTATVEYRLSVERAREMLTGAGFDVGSVAVDEVESGATFANVECTVANA
ncbi:SAM-dependent methyltransferase [Halobacteriales archaeon QH_10_70_21]|nr:MAG: SAM-dependent methyltransferase [Halobacteriales archaeon QH_10_70_21]